MNSIVMEFADDGDLLQKITRHKTNHNSFKEIEIWRVFIQAVKGLRALHELNIMHRDLKVNLTLTLECQCLSFQQLHSQAWRF